LIQDGLCGWCRAGSIFAQDIGRQNNERDLEKQPAPVSRRLGVGR
jgi:hypothetical protein